MRNIFTLNSAVIVCLKVIFLGLVLNQSHHMNIHFLPCWALYSKAINKQVLQSVGCTCHHE